jgi:prophage regulatory protein
MSKAFAPGTNRNRILTKNEVRSLFGNIGKTTLHRWINEGRFPRPVSIGPNRVGWVQSELDAFISKLQAERDAQHPSKAA